MHVWYDIRVDKAKMAEAFPVIIEIGLGRDGVEERPWLRADRPAAERLGP